MGERVRVSKPLRQRDRRVDGGSASSTRSASARGYSLDGMRAHAGIMAAEGRAEPMMPSGIVAPDALTAIAERDRKVAAKQRRRPAAMDCLYQQIIIVKAVAERHQLFGPRQRRRPSSQIIAKPQIPGGIEARARRPCPAQSRMRDARHRRLLC
jgi:hypothetical protein